jgi:hypothetical protein
MTKTYAAPSSHPVRTPILTGVLAELIAEESEAAGRRPQAADTFARFSDAGRCGRAIGFSWLERTTGQRWSSDATDDPAGQYVMWHGRVLHEHVMAAISKRFGGRVEVPSQLGETASGHCDWMGVLETDTLGRTLYELKTVGAYAFDKAVGLKRKSYTQENPEGPRISARLQGALNAVAHDCDTLIIGYIAMEAVSVALADKLGLSSLDRICAEWRYDRAECSPWAAAELDRMQEIANALESGSMPAPEAIGDEGQVLRLDPRGDRIPWNCSYCPFTQRCKETWS